MNKQLIVTWCTAILISTGLYAGGNMKNTSPEIGSYVNIPMEDTSQAFYVGLGVSAAQINSHNYDEGTIADVTAKVGYDLSEYFAIEFRGSKGISDGDQLSHDYSYGLYLRPQYPVNEDIGLYALLGYAQSKITFDNEVTFNGISNNYTKQNGFSYGVGVDYKLSKDWSLFVDAVRYIDEDATKPEGRYAIKVDAFSFGVSYHF